MPKLDDIFKSRFLRPGDLSGRRVVVTIRHAALERVGDDQRLVLTFKEGSKLFPLNLTNARAVAALAQSDDTDRWAGTRIGLEVRQVDFRGQTVDAVRVFAPEAGAAPAPPSPPDPVAAVFGDDDSDIPF